jgi:hypothetical protein
MDTILTLEGEIGRDNLSTQGKKRITTYHNLKKQVANLQNAYNGAEEEEKKLYLEELEEATEYLEDYSQATINFLQDELDDLKATRKAIEEKEKLKKEREQKQNDGNKADEPEKDGDEKKSGITGFIFAGLVLVATVGAVNYFRNK